jgi:hypothetical protein
VQPRLVSLNVSDPIFGNYELIHSHLSLPLQIRRPFSRQSTPQPSSPAPVKVANVEKEVSTPGSTSDPSLFDC